MTAAMLFRLLAALCLGPAAQISLAESVGATCAAAGEGGCVAENRRRYAPQRPRSKVRRPVFETKVGATESYYYPQGRGHVHHYGQSPHSFGGRACNLSQHLSWSWQNKFAVGGGRRITTGKALVDDNFGIYYVLEDGVRKFSQGGELLWVWKLPGYNYPFRHLPNHPALHDGLLYEAITDGRVFALDMETGFQVWESWISYSIGADDGFMMVYKGQLFLDVDAPDPNKGVPNRIVSLNASTGELLWDYQTDIGVWNFMPQFPGDDTMLFMGWNGAAHRLNISTGEELWRAGDANHGGWTDGGPALGPNGIFYTVSSRNPQSESPQSSGGGVHAFSVADGTKLWERTDLEQGIYTYPCVGRLDAADERLAVITGVGSLGSFPAAMALLAWVHLAPCAILCGMGAWMVWVLLRRLWSRWCRRQDEAKSERPPLRWLHALVWALCATCLCSLGILWMSLKVLNFGYATSIRAYDAETGVPLWKVDLPTYLGFCARGDEAGLFMRWWHGTRLLCLPVASGYGVIDAEGAFWMQHLDGNLWRVKDWNRDGSIEQGTDELCSVDLGSASTTGGVTIVPGMLLVSTCDSLQVFRL